MEDIMFLGSLLVGGMVAFGVYMMYMTCSEKQSSRMAMIWSTLSFLVGSVIGCCVLSGAL